MPACLSLRSMRKFGGTAGHTKRSARGPSRLESSSSSKKSEVSQQGAQVKRAESIARMAMNLQQGWPSALGLSTVSGAAGTQGSIVM